MMNEYYPQMPEESEKPGFDQDMPLWQPQYSPIPVYPQAVKRDWQIVTITATVLIVGLVGWILFLTMPPELAVFLLAGTIGLALIIVTPIFTRLNER